MEYFLGSIKLMFVTFAFTTVISMSVALIIKGVFAGIKLQQARNSFRAVYLPKERAEEPLAQGGAGQRERA
jgi:hypothetical protein